eukprot:1360175-Amorphochlora_amoeboformis.AAC.1
MCDESAPKLVPCIKPDGKGGGGDKDGGGSGGGSGGDSGEGGGGDQCDCGDDDEPLDLGGVLEKPSKPDKGIDEALDMVDKWNDYYLKTSGGGSPDQQAMEQGPT